MRIEIGKATYEARVCRKTCRTHTRCVPDTGTAGTAKYMQGKPRANRVLLCIFWNNMGMRNTFLGMFERERVAIGENNQLRKE